MKTSVCDQSQSSRISFPAGDSNGPVSTAELYSTHTSRQTEETTEEWQFYFAATFEVSKFVFIPRQNENKNLLNTSVGEGWKVVQALAWNLDHHTQVLLCPIQRRVFHPTSLQIRQSMYLKFQQKPLTLIKMYIGPCLSATLHNGQLKDKTIHRRPIFVLSCTDENQEQLHWNKPSYIIVKAAPKISQ